VQANPSIAIRDILLPIGKVALFALVGGFLLPLVAALLPLQITQEEKLPPKPTIEGNVLFRERMLPIVEQLIRNEELGKQVKVVEQGSKLLVTISTNNSQIGAYPPYSPQHNDSQSYYVSVQPFYLSFVSMLRPIEFLCLGLCAFAMPPSSTRDPKWRSDFRLMIICLCGILSASQIVPLWFRVFQKTVEEGRTVFAFTNPDLSWVSFGVQNIQFVISSFLLALIWLQWLSYAYTRYAEVTRESHGRIDQFAMTRLSFTMLH
jgi:hypothetical protein